MNITDKYEDGWYRIEAPRYVAAVRCENGVVVWAAPICRWMIGKDLAKCLWGGNHHIASKNKVTKMNVSFR
jgi:hypothetical protein